MARAESRSSGTKYSSSSKRLPTSSIAGIIASSMSDFGSMDASRARRAASSAASLFPVSTAS
jgi:hypothetical protein